MAIFHCQQLALERRLSPRFVLHDHRKSRSSRLHHRECTKRNQEAASRGRGRPPTHVDQRIDQLTKIVGTLVNSFQNWVFDNRGNQPQQGNLVDPVGVSGANKHGETQTEGIGEIVGHQQEASTSRTRNPSLYMGGSQRRALSRAQELEVTTTSHPRDEARGGLSPRHPRRDVVHEELASVQTH